MKNILIVMYSVIKLDAKITKKSSIRKSSMELFCGY